MTFTITIERTFMDTMSGAALAFLLRAYHYGIRWHDRFPSQEIDQLKRLRLIEWSGRLKRPYRVTWRGRRFVRTLRRQSILLTSLGRPQHA